MAPSVLLQPERLDDEAQPHKAGRRRAQRKIMASPSKPAAAQKAPRRKRKAAVPGSNPAIVEGLRELYGSVVEEPLPPAIADLLARLDEQDPQ